MVTSRRGGRSIIYAADYDTMSERLTGHRSKNKFRFTALLLIDG
jgi:hypothetical protein